ncbi:sugar ABC transporter substrate-binding protein [Aureimonas sp. Leaf454]|uniref:multiple monosaccharide ABC transporter substrate-binding protein n=1 Tax=Aureimonas sp. Leaf454 TaxID=1736381 RepID=UPI0006F9ABE8|nr:multiple monosaccharide ABC transporter substrate-binding protein [Aureimonas sp. Leaf454]KQT47586.1 sugar ABC transporter substrate-binding protein [Aureimonas sp. Leaf454]
MKSIKMLLAGAALGLALATPGAFAQDKGAIGVAMPDKTVARWIDDGANIVKQLTEKGYAPDLQYMVTKGAKVLVIASIDGTTLTDVLQQAADAGIKVIAYDRLIKNSGNVDYYATFDNFQVGVIQGTSIEQALDLKTAAGPFSIELFGGSPDDNNAFFFYNGAMSVLQPYIDAGKLVVTSGQTGMDKVGTLRWDAATAQSRMDNVLSAYYSDKKVDAILAPNDVIARGVISSLKGVGYGSGDLKMPVITGQDAEVPSIKSIIAGEQTSTVFKDTRELAKVTVGMVDAMAAGETVEVNDTKTYDNGVKVVPSQLLKPVLVTKENYKQVLVDSGYYTEEQLK